MDDEQGGLTQAEQMMRRVSPEGRARARKAAQARAGARNRVILQVALVVLFATVALVAVGQVVTLGPAALLAALALVVAVSAFVMMRARARPATPATLVTTDLVRLPARTGQWLEAQRLALPAPAVQLADSLAQRLDGLAPQLARLDPAEPAAEAVRKLLATELPGLVEGYRGVPVSLRARAGADGRTADAQLVDGLTLIDGEVARMTEQLARGAFDEVATQGRYLELKYRGEELGQLSPPSR